MFLWTFCSKETERKSLDYYMGGKITVKRTASGRRVNRENR